jgi:hypothetical protein
VIKHNFDQTPVLLENFDQVIRSSEIRSSDPCQEEEEEEEKKKKKNQENLNDNHVY